MSLKNYTSKIPYSKSLSNIEEELVNIGASRIIKEYGENKKVESLTFIYTVDGNDIPFLVPANVDATYKHLLSQKKKNVTPSQEKQLRGQAERTAWKNVFDWIRCQCVLIELSQVEFMEVFLPFAYDYKSKTTFYQRMKSGNFNLLN